MGRLVPVPLVAWYPPEAESVQNEMGLEATVLVRPSGFSQSWRPAVDWAFNEALIKESIIMATERRVDFRIIGLVGLLLLEEKK